MDFLIASVKVMYFPMLRRTLTVLGIIGLGVGLYTHQIYYIPCALILGALVNVIVVIIYVRFFAKFG